MRTPQSTRLLPVVAALVFAFALTLPTTRAVAQEPVTGTVIAGAALAVQIGVEIKSAIEKLGTAVVYAKAKTDGPDTDDRAISYDYDADHGLDWELDAKADATGDNNVDDKEVTPYTPGDAHWATIRLHYIYTGGQWKPNPIEDNDGKMQEFWGAVFAWKDDDPGKKDNKTVAAAVAAFSADGKSVDFCYSGSSSNGTDFQDVDKRPCPQGNAPVLYEAASADTLPEYTMSKAGAFLASIEQFRFESAGGDNVRIVPLRTGPIDLLHSYLQATGSPTILPMLRGRAGTVLQYSRDYYTKRGVEAGLSLDESPGSLAALTVVGLAVELDTLVIPRAGRTNEDLLLAYFADTSSARVIAPEHAQTGYTPALLWRSAVTSGQDVSALIGRDYRIPLIGQPSNGMPAKTLFGVMVGVSGGIDEAVLLAINTPGHWLRDRALAGLPSSAPSRGASTLSAAGTSDFDTGEMEFHDEDADWMESEANANSGQMTAAANCVFQVDASAYLPGPGDFVGLHGGVAPLPSVTQPGIPMRDDGIYPDTFAGDRIYAAMVPFAPGSPRIVHYQFDYNHVLECVGQTDRVVFVDDQIPSPTVTPARGIDCCSVTDKPLQQVLAVDTRTANPPPLPGDMFGACGDALPLPPAPPGLRLFDNGLWPDAVPLDGICTGMASFPPRTPLEVEYNYERNGSLECGGHSIRVLVLDDVMQGGHSGGGRYGLNSSTVSADQWMSCDGSVGIAEAVHAADGAVTRFAITGANPFAGATSLAFDLARPSRVVVRVLDARGAQVTVLTDRFAPSGRHAVSWTAHDVPAGVYLAQIDAGGARATQRLVLVR